MLDVLGGNQPASGDRLFAASDRLRDGWDR